MTLRSMHCAAFRYDGRHLVMRARLVTALPFGRGQTPRGVSRHFQPVRFPHISGRATDPQRREDNHRSFQQAALVIVGRIDEPCTLDHVISLNCLSICWANGAVMTYCLSLSTTSQNVPFN